MPLNWHRSTASFFFSSLNLPISLDAPALWIWGTQVVIFSLASLNGLVQNTEILLSSQLLDTGVDMIELKPCQALTALVRWQPLTLYTTLVCYHCALWSILFPFEDVRFRAFQVAAWCGAFVWPMAVAKYKCHYKTRGPGNWCPHLSSPCEEWRGAPTAEALPSSFVCLVRRWTWAWKGSMLWLQNPVYCS